MCGNKKEMGTFQVLLLFFLSLSFFFCRSIDRKFCDGRLAKWKRQHDLGITTEDSLADEVGKVERVANERHPTKQVRQAEDPHRFRHVDDGVNVFLQTDLPYVRYGLSIFQLIDLARILIKLVLKWENR